MSKNSAPATKTPASDEATNGLPLFFKRPVPLDAKRHAKASLQPSQDVSFAATTNSLLVNVAEFVEAAKFYPIVFTQGESILPAVVLGLEKQNYFIDAKNNWKPETYIPAYVRRYPFVFLDVPERKQFVLCVDEAAPQYRENGGKDTLALYDGENPSELTKNALEFCTAFQNHYQVTQAFCQALKEADLLTPTRSDAKLFNGREIQLAGFQVIDEKKFGALPDDKLLDLHKKGWLPLIYFALMSASNWRNLSNMAGAREKA
jgi:hypothetical protein